MGTPRWLRCWMAAGVLLWAAACSNGSSSIEPDNEGFSVAVTVSGLTGSGLVLQNNAIGNLPIGSNGTSSFGGLDDGAAYNVTVLTQPTAQICIVANGTGTISGANVTNVAVTCTGGGTSFAIGGTVTGLSGSGLVLQNNAGDNIEIITNGPFSFPATLAAGASYAVSVLTQPTAQVCSIVNASGTVQSDVTNVMVTCATSAFSISGTVTGLSGAGLQLQNGQDVLAISADGPFAFPSTIAAGGAYNVTVLSHPANQVCAVTNAAGTVTGANVSNVTVTCTTNFTVGGTVSGLSGSGLRLRLLAPAPYERLITTSGRYDFPVALPDGTNFSVLIVSQPSNPSQHCELSKESGVITGANVEDVDVVCTTNVLTIGGTVSGLLGAGLVLQKNGMDDLAIASNGSFTFANPQDSGTAYAVTVKTQPLNPSQTCTVDNGEGTVGTGEVRSIRVRCATTTFSVGGNVAGLLGTGLVLRNNGGNNTEVQPPGGTFIFTQPVASGGTYNVTVATQPTNPVQVCTVTNGTGTITNANVANVAVSCSTSSFTVGGTVSGLQGSGLVLRNNGADDHGIFADGSFTFPTALASGGTYNVTIASQPSSPAQVCTVGNASGTVGGSNVTSVTVNCVKTEFSIGGIVSGLQGNGLVLQNNGANDHAIAANGVFTMPGSVANGGAYNVTVLSQPTSPSQTCTVSGGSGSVSDADVTSVSVSCAVDSFSVGVSVTGLTQFIGPPLTLQLSDGQVLEIRDNGTSFFPDLIPSATAFTIAILQQPRFPPQACTMLNSSGTVGAANVVLPVTCVFDDSE